MRTNDTNIEIIYEDENVVVVNKPAGLIVHGDGKSEEPTLVDWLLKKYPEIKNVGESLQVAGSGVQGAVIHRSGIVHRLDRDTSGVMVVAKTGSAYEFLKKQFKERSIEKVYRALVYGIIKDDSGEVNTPIGKSRSDFRLWSAQMNPRGTIRDARTVYKVLERFPIAHVLARPSEAERRRENMSLRNESFTYLEIYPKSGRTHQIRVHMKSIFHPVVCDSLYAPKKVCPVAQLSRQALHAYSLELDLPTGKRKKFEAPLATDFQATLEYLRAS